MDKKSAAGPVAQVQGVVMPVVKPQVAFETRAITAVSSFLPIQLFSIHDTHVISLQDEKKRHVFKEMRQLRSKAKYAGVWQNKADEEAAATK